MAKKRKPTALAYPLQPCGLEYDRFRGGWTFKEAYDHVAFREGSRGVSKKAVLREMGKLKRLEFEKYQEECGGGASSARDRRRAKILAERGDDLFGLRSAPLLRTARPPSDYAIQELLDGKPGSLWSVASLTGMRTLIIAPGLALADNTMRGEKLAKTSVMVSTSVTLGMMAIYAIFGPRR